MEKGNLPDGMESLFDGSAGLRFARDKRMLEVRTLFCSLLQAYSCLQAASPSATADFLAHLVIPIIEDREISAAGCWAACGLSKAYSQDYIQRESCFLRT